MLHHFPLAKTKKSESWLWLLHHCTAACNYNFWCMLKNSVSSFLAFVVLDIFNNVWTWVVNCLWEGYFGVYFLSWEATRKINTEITLEWAHKLFIMKVHTLFYFLHNITSPYMVIKRGSSHIDPSHSLGLRAANDATIDCWWCQKCIIWCSRCDVCMQKAISNSLGIDFIQGHIYGRSCKKSSYPADNRELFMNGVMWSILN